MEEVAPVQVQNEILLRSVRPAVVDRQGREKEEENDGQGWILAGTGTGGGRDGKVTGTRTRTMGGRMRTGGDKEED